MSAEPQTIRRLRVLEAMMCRKHSPQRQKQQRCALFPSLLGPTAVYRRPLVLRGLSRVTSRPLQAAAGGTYQTTNLPNTSAPGRFRPGLHASRQRRGSKERSCHGLAQSGAAARCRAQCSGLCAEQLTSFA